MAYFLTNSSHRINLHKTATLFNLHLCCSFLWIFSPCNTSLVFFDLRNDDTLVCLFNTESICRLSPLVHVLPINWILKPSCVIIVSFSVYQDRDLARNYFCITSTLILVCWHLWIILSHKCKCDDKYLYK